MSRTFVLPLLLLCCALAVGVGGGTAAAEATVDRSFEANATPGDAVTVTTTIERDDDGPVDYAEEFDPAFEDVSLESLTLDGEPITPMLAFAGGDSLLVVTNDLEAGTLEIVFTVEVPDDANLDDRFKFDGDFRATPGTDPIAVAGDDVLTITTVEDDGQSADVDDDESGVAADDVDIDESETATSADDSDELEMTDADGVGDESEPAAEDELGLSLVVSILAIGVAVATFCWR
ncbi:hypothetical protein [Natronobeatus ordinarius]|uniref:hypothetical protein n=1 Tax=Natronobeatus ordinarius TaxID=2963433 RepID=UPI0020CFE37E|nr:hypothetical protein [Natronobeatus ordinarius]